MSLSRPVAIALIGAAAAVALFAYTRSIGNSDRGIPPPEPPTKSGAHAKPGKATASSPKTSSRSRTAGTKRSKATTKSSTGTTPSGPTPLSVPPRVAGALLKNKVVVVLFWSRRDPEDRRVKKAVDRLRDGPLKAKVAVFEDSPSRVANYSLVANGVSRTPALVVVDRARKAKVTEGYVDYTSIVQMIRTAVRARPG